MVVIYKGDGFQPLFPGFFLLCFSLSLSVCLRTFQAKLPSRMTKGRPLFAARFDSLSQDNRSSLTSLLRLDSRVCCPPTSLGRSPRDWLLSTRDK